MKAILKVGEIAPIESDFFSFQRRIQFKKTSSFKDENWAQLFKSN